MDEARFDHVRRAQASLSPRRRLMAFLGGVTLGGALPALLGVSETEARKTRAAKKKAGKGKPGPQGPAGPAGPQGPAGAITCPNGTLLHAGACIETTQRGGPGGVSFASARDTCLAAGRRLPTVAEMETFRNRGGTDISASQEYTGHIWTNGASNLVLVINNSGIAFPGNQNSLLFFRCVADPS
jgi:hypothetical protein